MSLPQAPPVLGLDHAKYFVVAGMVVLQSGIEVKENGKTSSGCTQSIDQSSCET